MEIQIGGAEGEGGEVAVSAIGKDDDGEIAFGETLDDGVKADGAAVMPHARVAAIGVEKPAESVGERFFRGGGFGQIVDGLRQDGCGILGRDGGFEFGGAEQSVIAKRVVPLGKVGKRTINSAIAESGGSGTLVGFEPFAGVVGVAIGAIRHDIFSVHVRDGVVHFERCEDALAQEVREGHS